MKPLRAIADSADDIAIHPEKIPARVKRQVINHLFMNDPVWRGSWAVYDGNKNAFVPGKKLGFEKERFKVVLPEDDGRPPRPGREGQERVFTIDVQFAAEINLHSLQAFCTGQIAQTNSALMSIVALNVLLRHEASIKHATKGASIYPQPTADADRFVIMGGIEMWRGYFSSLRPAPGKLIVNVDSTAMAFVQTGDLVKVRKAANKVALIRQVCCAFANMSDPARLAQLTDRLRLQVCSSCSSSSSRSSSRASCATSRSRCASTGFAHADDQVMVGASRDPATRKIIEYSPCASRVGAHRPDRADCRQPSAPSCVWRLKLRADRADRQGEQAVDDPSASLSEQLANCCITRDCASSAASSSAHSS